MPHNDIDPGSLANPEQPDARPMSRAGRLALRLLEDRARQAERQKERQRERPHESGPWWKDRIGFDPCQCIQWKAIAGPETGYLPKTLMRQGSDGFYVHCRGCNAEFESKGLAYCSACMKLPAEERHEMKPAFTGRMCQGPGCENPIPRTVKAGTRYCSGACQRRASRAMRGGAKPQKCLR